MKLRQDNLILIAIFISILSQAPLFRVKLDLKTQVIVQLIWIVVFIIELLQNKYIIKRTRIIYFQFFFILLGIMILELLTTKIYILGFTKMIVISLLIFFIGTQSKIKLTYNYFKRIAIIYIIASLFLTLDIYIEYFIGYNFQRIGYIYRAKNSAGQILLTAIIFLLFLFKEKKLKILKYILILFMFYEILLMRSRATLVSMIFIPIKFMTNSLLSLKNKIIIFSLIIIIIVLLCNENIREFVIGNILMNSTKNFSFEKLDINKISSNRISLIKNVPQQLYGRELLGLGSSFYVDNIFVNAIGNYGIIVGLLVIGLVVSPIFILKKYSKIIEPSIKVYIELLFIIYIFNGIFEGWAPFGPGIKCFLIWLFLGMILSNKKGIN